MKNFDEYVQAHRDICDHWTERGQRIIYLCDECADINPHWVSAKLNENDNIKIYSTAISRLKCKRELTDQQKMCLQEFKEALFQECTSLMAQYCL